MPKRQTMVNKSGQDQLHGVHCLFQLLANTCAEFDVSCFCNPRFLSTWCFGPICFHVCFFSALGAFVVVS